jgi:RNA polymerase sigma-70 factor (ECF subfamily)
MEEMNVTSVTPKDDWVERLKSEDDEIRDAALADLRDLLVRGLSRSLNGHYGNRKFNPEDIAQDALLKILNAIDTFEGRSRFTTWAMTIATRLGISELRRRHCRDISLEGIAAGDSLRIDLSDEQEPAGQEMDQQVILKQLSGLIDTELSEKQRLAIRGLLEGLPVEEIANRTGSNRNAVYKLVHDARTKLREGFLQSGIAADDIQAIFA